NPVRPWAKRDADAQSDAREAAPDRDDGQERLRRFALRHAAADAQRGLGSAPDADGAQFGPRLPADFAPGLGRGPAMYQPDPEVYEPVEVSDESRKRRRFGRRRAGADEPDPADAARTVPRHAVVFGRPDAEPESGPEIAPAEPARSAAEETEVPAAAAPATAGARGTGAPDEDAGDIYPWQRKDDVDLDLHGAPTWNPSDYPPEAEDTATVRRGRRTMRWLLARAPEPEPEPEPERGPAPVEDEPAVDAPSAAIDPEPIVAANPEPTPEPEFEPEWLVPKAPANIVEPPAPPVAEEPVPARADVADAPNLDVELADEITLRPPAEPSGPVEAPTESPRFQPGADLSRRLAAAVGAEAGARPEELAGDAETPPHRSLFDRVFRRGRPAAGDEHDEPLQLPEADAAFDTPWVRSPVQPTPTRRWTGAASAPAAPASTAGPGADPAPEPVSSGWSEPALVGAPEPLLAAEPELLVVAEPEPAEPEPAEPEPAVEPEPPVPVEPEPAVALKPRPSPEPHRPRPRPVPRRPGSEPPTPAGTTPPRPGRAQPPTIAGASSFGGAAATVGRTYQPDLSKFLEASEPQPGDDLPAENGKRRGFGSRRLWRLVLRLFIVVVIALGAAFLLRTYVVSPYYIPSASMEPTLHGCTGCNDDHVLVDKITYRIHDPQQNDLVVFNKPANAEAPEKMLIKRVIGLPGDRLQLKNGHVYINGQLVDEPYVRKACGARPTTATTSTSSWTIPDKHLFVMGDNRCNSVDSRTFGPIPTASVIGRAFAIIWPLNRIRIL
ncbi:MAG: signal peptidase, partial [Pseudonocardiales bacterium]|nr:signal peptidase [Pseudonocardiales bacterium]